MGDSSRSSTLFFDAIPQSEPVNGVHAQLSNQALFDKIDKLRDLGVHEFVALPQLVVVGDQSSGKSSVLEAVMDFPLPRNDTLCTRFATNITFRSSAQTSIAVSIIPGPLRSTGEKEQLRTFKREGLSTLDDETFLSVLKEACQAMGVPGPDEPLGNGKPTFSEDIFKIELCGPGRDNLSIIDIPGIFRTPVESTTREDMAMVNKMIDSWIRDKRTIILAIIGANVDIATQEILSMAQTVDPEGLRTLGVLTKPDIVGRGSEPRIIDIVNGKIESLKLKLGYCVVRNRSKEERDTSSSDRIAKENELFNSELWSALPRDRVGVSALRDRLRDLLADIVKREFPNIKVQLNQDLVHAKKQLAMIGAERENPRQQRRYLEGIAAKFEEMSKFALSTDYRDEIFEKDHRLRLPTLMGDRSDRFEDEIRTKGHTYEFHDVGGEENDDDEDEDEDKASAVASENESDEGGSENDNESEDEAGPTSENENGNGYQVRVILKAPTLAFPDLYHVLGQNLDLLPTGEVDILKWIKGQYLESRGYGLPAVDSRIMPMLWQKQSHNWKGITLSFINDTIVYVHDFICRLLRAVCPDSKVREALLSHIMDDLLAKYRSAVKHVEYILKVEHRGTLLTKNQNYGAALSKMRYARLVKATTGSAFTTTKMNGRDCIPVKAIEITAAALATSKSNLENVVEDHHHILYAYYKVATTRFVDTVMAQAMDDYLLTGENSPIKIITPIFVSEMTDAQLEDIAGEDAVTKRERQALKEKIAALERGKQVLDA